MGSVVIVALVLWLFLRSGGESGSVTYQEAAISRGQLVVKVSATGNLQPTNQVDIGSELSGTVETVYVDDNDLVKKGQILARLDTAKLKDQVQNSFGSASGSEGKGTASNCNQQRIAGKIESFSRSPEAVPADRCHPKQRWQQQKADLARAKANEASAYASVSQGLGTVCARIVPICPRRSYVHR